MLAVEVKKSSQVQIYAKVEHNVIAHDLGFGFLDVKGKKKESSKVLAWVTGWLEVPGWGKEDRVIIEIIVSILETLSR